MTLTAHAGMNPQRFFLFFFLLLLSLVSAPLPASSEVMTIYLLTFSVDFHVDAFLVGYCIVDILCL